MRFTMAKNGFGFLILLLLPPDTGITGSGHHSPLLQHGERTQDFMCTRQALSQLNQDIAFKMGTVCPGEAGSPDDY